MNTRHHHELFGAEALAAAVIVAGSLKVAVTMLRTGRKTTKTETE